jgi:hypothetical protein
VKKRDDLIPFRIRRGRDVINLHIIPLDVDVDHTLYSYQPQKTLFVLLLLLLFVRNEEFGELGQLSSSSSSSAESSSPVYIYRKSELEAEAICFCEKLIANEITAMLIFCF